MHIHVCHILVWEGRRERTKGGREGGCYSVLPASSILTLPTHLPLLLLLSLQHSQVFPNHYHPQFTSLSHRHQRASASSKKRQDTRPTISEEEKELVRYVGHMSEHQLFRARGDRTRFSRSYAWEQRWMALTQRVAGLQYLPLPLFWQPGYGAAKE